MGTQQIYLIVLAVIIVGIATGVAFTIFMNHQYYSNRQNMASEMATFAPAVLKYWNTSRLLAGADANMNRLSIAGVAGYIGFNIVKVINGVTTYSTKDDNGEFRVTAISTTDSTVTIQGLGSEKRNGKHPFLTSTISLKKHPTTKTVLVMSDATGW